jgi:hypothetical protein
MQTMGCDVSAINTVNYSALMRFLNSSRRALIVLAKAIILDIARSRDRRLQRSRYGSCIKV